MVTWNRLKWERLITQKVKGVIGREEKKKGDDKKGQDARNRLQCRMPIAKNVQQSDNLHDARCPMHGNSLYIEMRT